MRKRTRRNHIQPKGMVLLVTLVVLTILSIVGYQITSSVAMRRQNDQYEIDYQKAIYSRDSAIKYALAAIEEITPNLVIREHQPDFSDLFTMDQQEYIEYIKNWLEYTQYGAPELYEEFLEEYQPQNTGGFSSETGFYENDDLGFFSMFGLSKSAPQETDYLEVDPNNVIVPGPYGPKWPLALKPMEFEINNSKVTIEIEDENAKYPIGWLLLDEKEIEREIHAGFVTFAEWMQIDDLTFESVLQNVADIAEIKTFKMEFEPVRVVRNVPQASDATRGRRRRRVASRRTVETLTEDDQLRDFASLFHTMFDTTILARPTLKTQMPAESILKYIGTWGSAKVNINSAPRHVLEAAFAFGGDAVEIAEEIIQYRKVKPFADLDELQSTLFKYSGSISKTKPYLTTKSDFFTIRVTARSGSASASAVVAVRVGNTPQEGTNVAQNNQISRIAVFSE